MRSLNLLVGANGSGKSSILGGILLLKQTLEAMPHKRALIVSGPLVDLGSGQAADGFEMSVGFARGAIAHDSVLRCVEGEPSPACTYDSLDVSFSHEAKDDRVDVSRFCLTDRSQAASISGAFTGGKWYVSGVPSAIAGHVRPRFLGFVPSLAVGPIRPPDERTSVLVMDVCLRSMLRAQGVAETFKNVSYVAHHGGGIGRYLGDGVYLEEVPSGVRMTRWATDGYADRHAHEAGITLLTRWLEERLGVAANVRLDTENRRNGTRVLVADEPHGRRRINLAAFGRGISRFASLILAVTGAPRPGCLLIENPESCLDDGMQAAIADFLVDQLGSGRQFIIESHSGPFFERLRGRASDPKLAHDVQILSVEREDGWTKVSACEAEGAGIVTGSRQDARAITVGRKQQFRRHKVSKPRARGSRVN